MNGRVTVTVARSPLKTFEKALHEDRSNSLTLCSGEFQSYIGGFVGVS
jgi:hypothetical protein